MLVLSRQKDESIMIGDNCSVTVVDVRGDKVRLGITAPNNLTVHRKEIWIAIKKEEANRLIEQGLMEDAALKLKEIENAAPKVKSMMDKLLKR
jgi:carbon storage regulator